MKAIIYSRVSSREQEESGYSLDSQEKLLVEYADRKGFEVAKSFRVSESASGTRMRQVFTEMMKLLKDKGIHILICEKTDRLTRSRRDAVVVDDWIKGDSKSEVHFVKENFVLTQDSRASERLMWGFKVEVAQYYTNNLSEEVRKGQKEKVSQGWLPTKPPLGYMTVGDKGKKIHVPDKEKAHFVREMFELYASGNYSTRALVEEMYKRGLRNRAGRRLGKSRMHELLSNSFYSGPFIWRGETHKGAHEPLISVELFNLVQAKLNRVIVSPYYTKHLPVFKGKILCGACGHLMTWETQKNHWYGSCKKCKSGQGKTKYIRQEVVEKQVLAKLVSVAPKNERILSILQKALKESHSQEIEIREGKVKALRQIIDRVQRRLEVMYDDRLDGRITTDEFDARFQSMTNEREDALREMKKLEDDSSHYYRAGIGIHELALRSQDIYHSPKARTEDRRMLLSYAFKGMSLKDGELNVEYTPGFEFLAKWVPALNGEFEPQKTVVNKRQKAASATSCPPLLRG